MSATQNRPDEKTDEKLDWLELVRRQVGSLRYGVVEIVVHDSRVTQIEKTERVRLDRPPEYQI
ncbi:MAG TPA: YezD family protein [Candidatus Aquilonibacter sp.]|nr:YezD family protein [Candidatus Aquilonibacter sp.]